MSLQHAPAPPLSPIVLRLGRIGDMILLTSVLHWLRHRYQKPCLVVGAGAQNVQVYRGHPDVEQVWAIPRHTPFLFGLESWRVLRVLRRSDPSPVYVCEHRPRALVRVRRLLACSGINPARCLFVTDMPSDGNEPWVDRLLRFGAQTPAALRPADYPLPQTDCAQGPRLYVLESERLDMEAWIGAQGWSGRPLVLVQPGNYRSMSKRRERWRRLNADDKAWPLENWARLLEMIHARMPDALTVLCGAPAEGPMLREIQATARRPEVVVADLPLRPFLALCERAHSMISVDTGPAHAAAALGLPLVVLFGAESPRVWLPRGPSGTPILGVGGPPVSVRADQIPVDDVFSAWCALQAKREGSTQQPIDGPASTPPLPKSLAATIPNP